MINTRIALLTLITTIGIAGIISTQNKEERKTSEQRPINQIEYVPMTFDFEAQDVTFTPDQLSQHMDLYKGYVKKRNEIEKNLQTVDRSNVANITYSPFRSLKVAQVFARNASILHELYFENLATETEIGDATKKLLSKNFGSIEAFKKDLIDTSSCARGWVLTAYCLDTGEVKNFLLDAHHINVPVMAIPLLVVDVYEHAYMIEFGINRAQYLKDMWENINWDVVEKRVLAWVQNNI